MEDEQDTTGSAPTKEYTAISVLVIAVVGGLSLIIAGLLCLKYCFKKPPQTGYV